MATVKSKMGEHPVPKPGNQGSAAAKKYTQAPRRSGANSDTAPALGDQSKRRGVTPKPQGGSGTGSRRGDSLPR